MTDGTAEAAAPPPAPEQEAGPAEPALRRPGALRRLYNWVLHWADTPFGVPALGGLAFAESSFFPIPPDVLLMALAVGAPKRALRFALVCSVASVAGGLFGYAIGALVWDAAGPFFLAHVPGFTPEVYDKVQGLFQRYDFWIVYVAAFTPIPFKVFTVTSGVFGLSLPMFVLAAIVGRSARFFLVAGLIYKYGPKIRTAIDKYFDLFAILFVVLLVGGFAAIKLLHG